MNARILIVDDEPFNLEIISACFADSDYELVLHEAGEPAWLQLSVPDQHFDLVILDRMMPGLDGISLLKRIKADHHLAQLPVIMQTAASSPEQILEGLQAGAYYYLTKPYERDSLLSIARAALSDATTKADLQLRLKDHSETLQLLRQATFELRTIEEAGRLAAFLAQASPRPECTILGLSELLINSIEHGNLGITYAEKSELRRTDEWNAEVERRSALHENKNKRINVEFSRETDRVTIRISDQGQGFDWKKYLDFAPERAFDPNGRGIALARLSSFDFLSYEGCGNIVAATILCQKTTEHSPS